MSYNSSKLIIFSFALLFFALSSSPSSINARHLPIGFHIGTVQRTSSNANGDNPLIQNACNGAGDFVSQCISTMQSAPSHQKSNANGLAFFTLRFVDDQAANISSEIKKIASSNNPDLSPMLQSGLSDCMDQFNSFDDLVDNAVDSVVANKYSDAREFIEAAMTNLDTCDSQLKIDEMEDKEDKKLEDDIELAKDVKHNNLFLKSMLSAALNIVKAS